MIDHAPNAIPDALKRRSTRVVLALPLIITGVDALGRPFQERTSTAIVNCHGCRYQSEHFVLKNARVLLEVPHAENRNPRTVHARIASVRMQGGTSFIFGVELETAGNLWDIAFPPPDWFPFPPAERQTAEIPARLELARESAENNIGAMPVESERLFAYARQIARWMNESNLRLRSATPERENPHAAEEAPPLLKAFNAQIQAGFIEDRNSVVAETAPRAAAQPARSPLDETRAQLAELERAARQLEDRLKEQLQSEVNKHLASAATTAESWKGRLNADLADATKTLHERIETSVESAAQRAADRVARGSRETARQIEEGIGARANALDKHFAETAAEAENRLAAVKTSFDGEIKRAEEALSQIGFVAVAVKDQSEKLAALAETTQHELDRRASSALEAHSAELARRAEKSVAEWRAQLPALEASGRRVIAEISAEMSATLNAKLGVELDRELHSRLDLAGEMLGRLAAETHAAEDLLREHQNHLEKLSEGAIAAAAERLNKAAGDVESKIADAEKAAGPALEIAGQRIVSRLGAELDAKLCDELDEEFHSRLRVAGEMLGRLETETHAAEDLLRAHQNRLAQLSEQAIAVVAERLEKAVNSLESRIQETEKAAGAKHLAQIGGEIGAEAVVDAAAAVPAKIESIESDPGGPDMKERTSTMNALANASPQAAPRFEGAAITLPPTPERRGGRRTKVSRPILARPSDPRYKEAVETSLNASRTGVYFMTQAEHYYVGMHLSVMVGYAPNDPCNTSSFGEVVRIDRHKNGSYGIAVHVLLR